MAFPFVAIFEFTETIFEGIRRKPLKPRLAESVSCTSAPPPREEHVADTIVGTK